MLLTTLGDDRSDCACSEAMTRAQGQRDFKKRYDAAMIEVGMQNDQFPDLFFWNFKAFQLFLAYPE